MKLRPLPFFLLLLTPAGCDQLNPKATSIKAKPTKVTPVHRFVLTRADEGVAFDTQTGQICRTWDWKAGGKPLKPDPETGNTPQRSFGEFAPTCLYLYEQYPSTPSTQAEAQADEQNLRVGHLKPQLCIYCNLAAANTVDHIPPKLLLAKPYPANLLTVPSCLKAYTGGLQRRETRMRISDRSVR